MNISLFIGYFITLIYCSKIKLESERESENEPLSPDKFPLTPAPQAQDNRSEGRGSRVPLRYRSFLAHERNINGLRDILIRVRAERQNKKNSETEVEKSTEQPAQNDLKRVKK